MKGFSLQKKKIWWWAALALLLALGILNCRSRQPAPPWGNTSRLATSTTAPAAPPGLSPSPTAAPLEAASPTAAAAAEAPCAYVWASQPLDEVSQLAADRLRQAGLEAEVRAEAYGEDCRREDGSSAGFTPMQTDFRLTLYVDDLTNREALGQQLEAALEALLSLPPEALAGPNAGYLGVTFQTPQGDSLRLWQPLLHVASLRAEGRHGAALLEALLTP